MAGRASIVGAAETNVGRVRDHNEDSHFIDPEAGIFIVCDGMGGHAAGEVASALAVKTIRAHWQADDMQGVVDRWLLKGTPEAKKQLLASVTSGVIAAHDAIVAEAQRDRTKHGMGTTVIAAIVVGGDVVFAQSGDSRAYLVRDGITVQLTEDHTLLARLLAAGVDVDVNGDGARFKSMLTNALGIGQECKVSTFIVPVADGDRFMLCSDGITEYVQENEIGEVLTTMPSPARSAQKLVEMALQRGGGDNATALVVRVLEAGETARPSDQLKRELQAINSCPLWAKLNPQQRLRAQRIALPRDYATGEKLPAQTLGDRVAWILVEGELEQDGFLRGPGSLIYPEALLADRPLPDKDGLAVAQSEIRALALRSDDFKELCDDDPEIGEHLLSALGTEISRRRPQRRTGKMVVQFDATDGRGVTDPGIGTVNTDETETVLDPPGRALRAATAPTDPPPPEPAPAPPKNRDDIAFASTIPPGARVAAVADAEPPREKPRQPRGSTVPPTFARTRASTEPGAVSAERAPAEPVTGEESGRTRLSRGTTPPNETRSSLIVAPADTAAAVDQALTGLTDGDGASKPGASSIPSLAKPAAKVPAIPQPVDEPMAHMSEPEISIEELQGQLASDAARENDEPSITLTLDDVDEVAPRKRAPTDSPD